MRWHVNLAQAAAGRFVARATVISKSKDRREQRIVERESILDACAAITRMPRVEFTCEADEIAACRAISTGRPLTLESVGTKRLRVVEAHA